MGWRSNKVTFDELKDLSLKVKPEACLGPTWTYTMEFSCEDS